ncbi:hypothetical protein Tco_1036048 [Tanacetum coccineum]
MESQSDSTQTVSSLKLLMLKIGDYDLWSMWMEQYLTHINYALWEVIVNGDAPAVASASTEGLIPPKTSEQKERWGIRKAGGGVGAGTKEPERKGGGEGDLWKFHGIVKDAKSLWRGYRRRAGCGGLWKATKKSKNAVSPIKSREHNEHRMIFTTLEGVESETLAALMKSLILLMKFLPLTHSDKLPPSILADDVNVIEGLLI